MIAPVLPPDLDDFGLAAWNTAYRSAVAHRIWRPEFCIGLAALARVASSYIRDPEPAEVRRLLRQSMIDFAVLPAGAADFLGEVRPDGIDADIAALCGLAPPAP